jgi:uncharacterized YigZ family protein
LPHRFMEVYSYRTIQHITEGEYKEKGSKFLAFACPVESEDDVKERLVSIKKKYFDARHHCYAYVLGADKSKYRANDDGEPNHSAGDPILGQIRSKNLTNVLVVVVRYFGGVKLGVGGLITAYKAAAEDALAKADIIEEEVMQDFKLEYDYGATPEVMRMVKDFELVVGDQTFEEHGSMNVKILLKYKNEFLEKVTLLKALGNVVEVKELD